MADDSVLNANHGEKNQSDLLFRPFFFSGNSGKGWTWVALALVIIVFFLPVLRLICLSFSAAQGISLENYRQVLSETATWKILKNTLIITGGATLLALLFGVLAAWLVAYSDIRAKKLLQTLIVLPLIIPSYIITLAWTQLLSPGGMAARILALLPGNIKPWNIYSFGGIIMMMGISYYPLVYLLTRDALRRISRDAEAAARVAGLNKTQVLLKITLPLALPGIAGGGLLAFLASLDNFGIPAFLGIPARINVLSTYIYQQIIGFGPSAFAQGAALSVLLGLIALAGTALQWWLVRKHHHLETVGEDRLPRLALGKCRPWVEFLFGCFLIGGSVVPLVAMAMASLIKAYGLDFTPVNLTLKHYHFILFESQKTQYALRNSLLLGLAATLICLFFGTALAYYRMRRASRFGKLVELVVGIPYALPGMVLALAMIFSWMEPLPGWNPGIYGSIWILVIAYVTRFMILQVRGSIAALMQVDPSMEEAARICGAGMPARWRKILVPLLLSGICSGAFLVLISALTELTLSSLLWSSGAETIGLTIFNFEQAGFVTYSASFSTLVVMLILAAGLLLRILQKFWQSRVVRE
ncbi:iron(III) transport system permease protein [Hydrogenispora ethanolica]|uniref:Iron(III) transport system permease protein n=1 Tax=Hydrogenispora ethanolica TaxID=1082276 RepID=A0A4R1RKI7_HYDET|nr:iron ABC transporter permease [Hydrogenispora ethanolica]TCL66529.1 iron(III) transport system permease protein [Hydrogenispora ethanolica]